MGKYLSTYTDDRDNNFNLIRFVAAFLVLYTHSFVLTGTDEVEFFYSVSGMTLGSVAVDVFFITSGFLIAGSFFERNNIIAFVWARVLRIYPALIVAVLFCVFVVGLYFTTNSVEDYLSDRMTYSFLLRNFTLFFGVNYHLPGVFTDVPYERAINGSLWTLPYEVKMYACLAVIASVIIGFKKWIGQGSIKVLFIGIATVALLVNIINHFHQFVPVQYARLFSMFFVGAAFYVCRDHIRLIGWLFYVLIAMLLLSLINKELFFAIYYIALPYLVFYVAYVPSGRVRTFNKAGDYSYGIYIYAFPVQQSVVTLMPEISVSNMIPVAFIITLCLAFLSWHVIEKSFLTMKYQYIHIDNVLRYLYASIARFGEK